MNRNYDCDETNNCLMKVPISYINENRRPQPSFKYYIVIQGHNIPR
jgi:hypothetical protein